MFKLSAIVGILSVFQISIARARCCDEMKAGIKKRTLAYNMLCENDDQDLAKCCGFIKEYIVQQQIAYNKLCRNHVIQKSCYDLYLSGVKEDGVYTIDPDGLGSFKVSCDMSKDGGGWTVFQRRQDGSQDFTRKWSDYKAGFGDLNGEFWLGLDKIHRLTKSGQNVLRVDLKDFNGDERYAKYGTFSVADESDKYKLKIEGYSGDAGNSFRFENGQKFTTIDNDNDRGSANCAKNWKGGWWYRNCAYSNLNGLYLGKGKKQYSGIHWRDWESKNIKFAGIKMLKNVDMKMRPSGPKS
ncbi:ryncolin-1-like [Dendronephthya gigantea]|uniref:ryncolin-1-like n=1 Tax=Dendronephthya gigantea TaxID=151771 RepID=UPI00106AD870|nr:ryncolin-1-like [Dendronephthya gigantea]